MISNYRAKNGVKMEVSKYTRAPESNAKTKCRKLCEKHSQKIVILDAETYVNTDTSQMPGNIIFMSNVLNMLNTIRKLSRN